MNLVGLGTDLVEIARIAAVWERHGDRFLRRCFSDDEAEYVSGRVRRAGEASLAARWAAKEAFLKALGGEVADVPYGDIAVARSGTGAVSLVTRGRAAELLAERGVDRCHLSLSHDGGFALATVVLEG